MTIKLTIAGARGRMGSEAIRAIEKTNDIEIISILDYKYDGLFLYDNEVNDEKQGIPIFTSFQQLIAHEKPDVLLDLTTPEAVYENMYEAIRYGIRPVVGTSGLQIDQIQTLSAIAKEQQVGGIIAPNFSIGAILMMKFSAMAARYFEDIEIIELHHNQKLDAPSGTASKTAEMISSVREKRQQGHPDEKELIEGARGANLDGMRIHSVRLPGLLAHQEVLLGGEGELLTLRHDSFNRHSFMSGIIMSIRKVINKKELLYGLENIIE